MPDFTNPDGIKIPGYRAQSEEHLRLVAFHKTWEERMLRHLDWLARDSAVDLRWLAVGRTAIEQGFMAINRAVMQPQRIGLPEDDRPDELPANQQPFYPEH